ncbi:MAG: uracil-DNA glycosylase [Nitrososphaerales archaeon]
MNSVEFVKALSEIRLKAVFNPYRERCPIHDRADAPTIRRTNLLSVIQEAMRIKVESIWIARDLGYRGGRRTGLPLTDEIHLPDMSRVFGGIPLTRSTTGSVVAERTAKVIWGLLSVLGQPVFLWNIFPLHPFEPGSPLSNRCHTRAERENCDIFLFKILQMLMPERIVAIGRDAEMALNQLGIPCCGVRHPSYGGEADFIRGMMNIYGKMPRPLGL